MSQEHSWLVYSPDIIYNPLRTDVNTYHLFSKSMVYGGCMGLSQRCMGLHGSVGGCCMEARAWCMVGAWGWLKSASKWASQEGSKLQ